MLKYQLKNENGWMHQRLVRRKSDMERGEIWLVSLDPTAGHEQQGTRPVLIVTPAAFNRVTRLPVVVPVTSGGNFARTAGFAVSLDGVGIRTTGVVRCDRPRTIDMKARGGKRLERVPETIMNEVLGRLSTILT
ncbi:TPA: type II toxin-antitoxin system toxin endoribonuclease PemK [Escherichia coli]|nr:type II toxin-antitoxin system toxin endoribonuclease PemK [Escherichia coli]HAW1220687.1 type II toxin-antitoxin system toxin endoribonuclease PemK [Escherichia coli]HCW2796561.1 type II toxin-antitoxin system toxin endoribonuclease PemK [Escherichia coli]